MYKILYNDYPPNGRVIIDNRRFDKKTLENRLENRFQKQRPAPEPNQIQEKYPTYDVPPPPPAPAPALRERSASASASTSTSTGASASTCGGDTDGERSVCGTGKNLFPIMDPRFNLRETAKNMVLLEDHLFNPGKQCLDCIVKHSIMIEGFLEECVTLDKKKEYSSITNDSLSKFRELFKKMAAKIQTGNISEDDCCDLAQELRAIRKPLCQQFGTFVQ